MRGQNFVTDANTVRRIVRTAHLTPDDVVIEVGPGLGSLTLGLLAQARRVVAIEIDPVLAAALPTTVRRHRPDLVDRLTVISADAMTVDTHLLALATGAVAPEATDGTDAAAPLVPTAVVSNLPYNVSVPVLLHLLEVFTTLRTGLVMVQAEVAERLAAPPGSRVYGVPSVKAAWYAEVTMAGQVARSVFWPVPGVDSSLVRLVRRPAPTLDVFGAEGAVTKAMVFSLIDAAFAQRRKTLRAALAGWAGSAAAAEQALRRAGIDPRTRGEQLTIRQFVALAQAGVFRAESSES